MLDRETLMRLRVVEQIALDSRVLAARGVTNPFWAQPAWYINATSGSDANSGADANHPLKTAGAYLTRVGLNRLFSTPVDFFLQTDLPQTDPLVLSGVTLQNGLIGVHGTPRVVRSSQLTGYTDAVPGTNTPWQIQDAAVSDYSPYRGKLLRVTSGPASGQASAWIAKTAGAGAARVAPPRSRLQHSTFVPVGNETYDIVDLPTLSLVYDVRSSFQTAFPVTVEYSSLVTLGFGPYLNVQGGIQFLDCTFDALGAFEVQATNCRFVTGLTSAHQGRVSLIGGFLDACTVLLFGAISFDEFALVQGCSSPLFAIASSGCLDIHDAGLAIFESDAFLTAKNGATHQLRGSVFGSGNTTTGLRVYPGSKILQNATFTLAGGGGYNEIAINGKTQLPAVDPVAFTYTANRALSFANLAASFGAGGFGGTVYDPVSLAGIIGGFE